MPMNDASEQLKRAIVVSVRVAVERLFRETGESFYYFSLITTGEAHAPVLSAWSREKLAAVPEADRSLVKWSYADSPYFDFGSEEFGEVRELFDQRPYMHSLEGESRFSEYKERLAIMEQALSEVDASGVFGRGAEREKIVIHVEVMPPDHTNTERAKRLNPPRALGEWLEEAGEESAADTQAVVAGFLGELAVMMLSSPPFRDWTFVRTVEDDPDDPVVHYECEDHAVDLSCDGDEMIRSIFLHSDRHRVADGCLCEVRFDWGRQEVRDHMGVPSKSGEGFVDPVLGEYGGWDLFPRPGYAIHVEYRSGRDEVRMITLMRDDVVP